MKKTVRVNIGGFVFNLDDDAYYKLEKYLKDIFTQDVNKLEKLIKRSLRQWKNID